MHTYSNLTLTTAKEADVVWKKNPSGDGDVRPTVASMPKLGFESSDDSPDRPCLTLRTQNPATPRGTCLFPMLEMVLLARRQGVGRMAARTDPAGTLVQIDAVQNAYIEERSDSTIMTMA